jgi:phosphatidylglycerophosphate synthase
MPELTRGEVSEASPRPEAHQGRRWTVADALSASRVPLAIAFLLVGDNRWRIAILAAAAGTDLLDGHIARRLGSSRLGAFVDPVADKLFMVCAFAVIAISGRLDPFEIVGVLVRDIVATIAFVVTSLSGRPASIPARIGGKAVTVGQVLTVAAFLLESPYLRPMAWATAAVGLYAIWDYQRVAGRERRRV